jgi:hypothetical protein
MNATSHEPLNLYSEELAVLAAVLESERVTLLMAIRHTHHSVLSRRTPQGFDGRLVSPAVRRFGV